MDIAKLQKHKNTMKKQSECALLYTVGFSLIFSHLNYSESLFLYKNCICGPINAATMNIQLVFSLLNCS